MKKYILYILLALFIATPVYAQQRVVSYKQGFYSPQRGGVALNPNLWEGLVAGYNFSLGNTGNIIRDQSGFKRNMVNFGADWGTDRLSFVSANVDRLELTSNPIIGYPFTFAVRGQASAGSQCFINIADASAADVNFALVLSNSGNGDIALFSRDNSQQDFQSNTDGVNRQGVTVSLVAIWESSTLRHLYIDGVFINTATTEVGYTGAADRLRIGQLADNTPNWELNGHVEYGYLYNRMLLPNEAMQFHNDPLALFRTRRIIGRAPVVGAERRFINIAQLTNRITGGITEKLLAMYRNN